jgi:hypothetical protein
MAMNPEPRQRGGDQVLKGKRTLMSNARVQRGRVRHFDADVKPASRPPLQRLVMPTSG